MASYLDEMKKVFIENHKLKEERYSKMLKIANERS